MMRRRAQVVADLTPQVGKAYEAVARGASRDDATLSYRPSFEVAVDDLAMPSLEADILAALEARRRDELDRGLTLVGPHRDELVLTLGDLPVKGYASHGECWSFALALRLASYDLLRSDGDDPVLILDDVFAELDSGRREQLADLVGDAEQVLITAAVPEDVPVQLRGRRFTVAGGEVTLDE
jgi:DNA replication and repair protein RecF